MIGLQVTVSDLLRKKGEDQAEYWLSVNFVRRNGEIANPTGIYVYTSMELYDYEYYFSSPTLMRNDLEQEFPFITICKKPIPLDGGPTEPERCTRFTTKGIQNALKFTCQKK
jgi:hypothetical protein